MEKPKFRLFKAFEGNRYLRLFISLKVIWRTGHALESVVVVSAQQGPHLWSPACLLPLERAAQLAIVGRHHFYIWRRGRGDKHFAQEFCSNLLTEDLAGPHLRILTVSPFSERSGSPALPWGATLTPPAPGCVAHLQNGGAEVPIQPHTGTARRLAGPRTLHATCNVHHASVSVSLQQRPFSWSGSAGPNDCRCLFSFPLSACPRSSSLHLSCSHLPQHFSSSSPPPHLSFQTVTSCFLQSQPPIRFLIYSLCSSSQCSCQESTYPSSWAPTPFTLNSEAPTSWWKPCHRLMQRMKLYFSAISIYWKIGEHFFFLYWYFKEEQINLNSPPVGQKYVPTTPAVAQVQHNSLKKERRNM